MPLHACVRAALGDKPMPYSRRVRSGGVCVVYCTRRRAWHECRYSRHVAVTAGRGVLSSAQRTSGLPLSAARSRAPSWHAAARCAEGSGACAWR